MIQQNKQHPPFIENEETNDLDLIIETLKGEYNEETLTGDLCITQIMKLKEPRKVKEAELLEESEGLITYTPDEIGKKYGDGHFQLSFKIFERTGDKKKVKKWPKYYFTLGESYRQFKEERERQQTFKRLEADIRTGQLIKGENNSNELLIEMLRQQREDQKQLIEVLLAKQNTPQNQMDIPALITAIASFLPLIMPKQDDSFKELLFAQLNEKNNLSKEMFSMAKESFELGKTIAGGNNPEPTTLETILGALPAIADSFKPLLTGLGSKMSVSSAQKLASKQLSQYKPHIEAIKTNPQALQTLEKEMSKHYSNEQIERMKQIAEIHPTNKLQVK